MTNKINIRQYIEPFIHLIIWSSVFVLLILEARTLGPFRRVNGSIYYPIIFGTIVNAILFYTNALYLIPRYIPVKRTGNFIFFTAMLYIGLSMLESIIDHFCFIAYYSTEKEPFFVETTMNFINNALILSLSLGYGFTKYWIKNEHLQQTLSKDKLTAELNFLKAQINPHFLFNTLNLAYASALKSGDNNTAGIIEKLAGLMRYVLYESNGEKVLLEKEINYVENYINLQLQRLSPEISKLIKFEIKGDWQQFQIAPMILIPFIENIFKHGITLDSNSEVEISLYLKSNVLTLITRNALNRNKMQVEKTHSGIGLINVRERLNILYSNQHRLEIETKNNIYRTMLELQL
jgi:hypothetical protein